ncbi:hypothetical protein JXQ31_18565 [candidate division KSB1 bacterium]|nr:hypothetical protein [candidate division KSB1 bacterium]
MKPDTLSVRKILSIIIKLTRYNLKIIFGNIFIYFLLGSIGFYLLISVITFFDSSITPTAAIVYYLLLFPGLLLIFYPTTFGIQYDSDTRMLEVLFGIPDYRYKVWLVRLAIIYVLVFCILIVLAFFGLIAFTRFSILNMVFQLMFPIFFIGSLAFMTSTLVRNGYGAMVILIIVGMVFWVLSGILVESQWNLFLNPFRVPENVNEIIWADIKVKNRLYILSGTILMLLFGLFNMQKREKFV